MTTLQTLIESACAATPAHSRQRSKALSRIKWRLKSGLLYAGLGPNLSCAFVGPDDALVFDARDNDASKLAFWSTMMKRPFEVELCAS